MKKEFWRFNLEVFVAWPLVALTGLTFLTLGIILSIKEIFYIMFIFIGIIFLTICIYNLFVKKKTLSKIVFTQKDIKITWFEKVLYEFSWSEISEITTTFHGKGSEYLTICIRESSINIMPSKKIYDAFIFFCPYQRLIDQIESIPAFEWFRRKR